MKPAAPVTRYEEVDGDDGDAVADGDARRRTLISLPLPSCFLPTLPRTRCLPRSTLLESLRLPRNKGDAAVPRAEAAAAAERATVIPQKLSPIRGVRFPFPCVVLCDGDKWRG